MKQCSKCGRPLPSKDFFKDSTHYDGLSSRCKKCYKRKVGTVEDVIDNVGDNVGHIPITYFIKCKSFVKIGVTSNIKKRLSSMRTSNPFDLKLIGVMIGEHHERILHSKFSGCHHYREWYKCTNELRSYIKNFSEFEKFALLFE